jgi:cation diffusion facilitator CzcD-associated flavoprotein CzcO
MPNLQPLAKRLDHYVRGKTWIATPMAAKEVELRTNGTGSNFSFTEEEISTWRHDPALYRAYRRRLEEELQSGHELTIRDSAMQNGAREAFTELMKERLADRPDIAKHLLPTFPPLCKRLTPGPGYLESLTKSNVDIIATPISKFTETGIITEDGTSREVDAIICATGFDTTHRNRFPIYGEGGVLLGQKWKDRADSYLSMTTHGFPNLFMSLGPNSGLGSGNLLIMLERIAAYVAQCAEKMQMENIRSMVPSQRAVNLFTDFCDVYFKGTVYSEECSSWYKTGGKNGRVTALWPGSSLHATQVLEKPRWEDFDFTYADGNEFGWFGDGWTERERKGLDKSYYIQQTFLDEPSLAQL